MNLTLMASAAGTAAAFCFGVGDYLSRGITHRVGWARTFLWVQIVSFFPLVAIAAATTGAIAPERNDLLAVGALGLCNSVGIVGLYRSFEIGVLSVVSPIASTFAVVTVAWALLFGHALEVTLLLALVVTMSGVVLVSREDNGGSRSRVGLGAGWALLSSVCFGTVFFFLDPVTARLGAVWPIAGLRVVGAGFAALWLWRRRGSVVPGRVPWRAVALVAALDSGGMVVYAAGTQAGEVAIVAVLASCFSAITVFLAHLRLRERLSPLQWAGLALLLAGVAWTTWQGSH